MIDRRHPYRAALDHLGQRLVVELDPVLDRVGAGAHGVLHARRAVRMDGHFPSGGVRRVDDRLHLVEGQRLRCLDAVEAAARGVDLDPVGSRLHACVHLGAHRVRRRPGAAPGRNAAPGDEHPRADERARGDAVAHQDVGSARRAEIADRRHAGLERPLRVFCGDVRRFFRSAPFAWTRAAWFPTRGPRNRSRGCGDR